MPRQFIQEVHHDVHRLQIHWGRSSIQRNTIAILALLVTCTQTLGQVIFRDDFDSAELESSWTLIREDSSTYSLSQRTGFFHIDTQRGSLGEDSTAKNLLLREFTGDFIIDTKVEFNPRSARQFAGLLAYLDDTHGVSLGLAFAAGERGEFRGIAAVSAAGSDVAPVRSGAFYDENTTSNANIVFLRMLRSGNQFVTAFSADGVTFTDLTTLENELPETILVGVGASNGDPEGCGFECDVSVPADFDFFQISSFDAGNVTDPGDLQPDPNATLISVNVTGPDEISWDDTATFTATALFDDDSEFDVTAEAQWVAAPADLALVEFGVVSPDAVDGPVQVTIVATFQHDGITGTQEQTGSALLRIVPPALSDSIPTGCGSFSGSCGPAAGAVGLLVCCLWGWKSGIRRNPRSPVSRFSCRSVSPTADPTRWSRNYTGTYPIAGHSSKT